MLSCLPEGGEAAVSTAASPQPFPSPHPGVPLSGEASWLATGFRTRQAKAAMSSVWRAAPAHSEGLRAQPGDPPSTFQLGLGTVRRTRLWVEHRRVVVLEGGVAREPLRPGLAWPRHGGQAQNLREGSGSQAVAGGLISAALGQGLSGVLANEWFIAPLHRAAWASGPVLGFAGGSGGNPGAEEK